VITELFYNNEVGNFDGLYGQGTPSNINDGSAFDGWGHFSQIVWKSTTQIGCATYDCSGRGLANTGGSVPPHFTVCNYKPAGKDNPMKHITWQQANLRYRQLPRRVPRECAEAVGLPLHLVGEHLAADTHAMIMTSFHFSTHVPIGNIRPIISFSGLHWRKIH
jgi:hypothetical protein